MQDCTIIDIESTGLNVHTDKIIEVGAARVRNNQITTTFSMLINIHEHVPEDATATNHITDEMLESDGLDKSEVMSQFVEFIGSDTLLGHNIEAFDYPFLAREIKEATGKTITNRYVDSLKLARTRLPHLASRSLEFLSRYYQVSYDGAHRGLQDCYINYSVYQHLICDELPQCEKVTQMCPKCQNKMKLRIGKYGKFFGCTSYPNCNGTTKWVNS